MHKQHTRRRTHSLWFNIVIFLFVIKFQPKCDGTLEKCRRVWNKKTIHELESCRTDGVSNQNRTERKSENNGNMVELRDLWP